MLARFLGLKGVVLKKKYGSEGSGRIIEKVAPSAPSLFCKGSGLEGETQCVG